MPLVTTLRSERRADVVWLAVVIRLVLPVFVVMLSFAPVNQPGNARAASAHFDPSGIPAHKNIPAKTVLERDESP